MARFLLPARSQTVEFFAGGNDEVELRVDGQLLLRRNLTRGDADEGHGRSRSTPARTNSRWTFSSSAAAWR